MGVGDVVKTMTSFLGGDSKPIDESLRPSKRKRGRPTKQNTKENTNSTVETTKVSSFKARIKSMRLPLRRSSRLNPSVSTEELPHDHSQLSLGVTNPTVTTTQETTSPTPPIRKVVVAEEQTQPSTSAPVPKGRVVAATRIRRKRKHTDRPDLARIKDLEETSSSQRARTRHEHVVKQEEEEEEEEDYLQHKSSITRLGHTTSTEASAYKSLYTIEAAAQFEQDLARRREASRKYHGNVKYEMDDDLLPQINTRQFNHSSGTDSSGRPPSMSIPSPPPSHSAQLDYDDDQSTSVPNRNYSISYDRNRSYALHMSVQPPSIAKVNDPLYPPPVVRLHIRDLVNNTEIPAEDELNMLIAQVSVHDETGTQILAPPSSEYLGGEWSRTPSLLHDSQPVQYEDENYGTSILRNSSNDEIKSIVSIASEHVLSPPIANYVHAPPPLPENYRYAGDHVNGSFVMFPNLILRRTGNFRLKVTLFAIDGGNGNASGRPAGGSWVADMMTNVVRIQDAEPDNGGITPEEQDFLHFLRERGVSVPDEPTD